MSSSNHYPSLIREVVLSNGRRTTNFGFGCASLLRLASGRQRRALIGRAFGEGVRHFDVARMYGLGAAEQELGFGLGSNRSQATIATKFGFPAKGTTAMRTAVQSVGRFVIGKLKGLRKGVKKGFSDPPRDYSLAGLKESLETSLSQLNVEQVDVLFYHEARNFAEMPAETTEQLKAYVQQGKIGGYGVSTFIDEAGPIASLAETSPDFLWQVGIRKPGDYFNSLPEMSTGPFGVFGLIGGLAQPVHKRLSLSPVRLSEWSERLGLNLRDFEDFSISTLAVSSVLYPESLIIFSTTHPKRLSQTLGYLQSPKASEAEFKEYAQYLATLSAGEAGK
ncbi:aldo/keto reductase [Planctomicrobium sp. SH668]|uniref:aldo/keto reductase n=1 Tax=Planctomicrobium sp. SH668 TaxID=3448126 RepID=UPI003F5B894A